MWKVTGKKQMPRLGETQYHRKDLLTSRKRRIEVKLLRLFNDILGAHDVSKFRQGYHCGSLDKCSECSASMRQNDLDIGKLLKTSVEDHVHGCTACFVWPIKSGHWKVVVKVDSRDIVDGVNKDSSLAAIQLFPDGKILRVSKVSLRSSITGEQGDSICLQSIKSVVQFLEYKIRVLQRWDCRKESIHRVCISQTGGIFIHGASNPGALFKISDVGDSRSADGVYGRGDAVCLVEGSVTLNAP